MCFASSLFSLFLLDHVRGVSRSVGHLLIGGVWVVDVGVILVWSCGHWLRDYSLTLIVGVILVWSSVIGLIGSQGIGCDL